jgi:hypothetical protein
MLSKLAERKQDQKMRQEILERRRAVRRMWVREMLEPCVRAWFERLRKRLEALNPKPASFSRRQEEMLDTIRIWDDSGEAEDWFSLWFGVGYHVETGNLSLIAYLNAWQESSYPSGRTHSVPLEWPSYKDERVIALLDETWEFLEKNLKAANTSTFKWKNKGKSKTQNFWEVFGFKPKTNLLRDPDEDI